MRDKDLKNRALLKKYDCVGNPMLEDLCRRILKEEIQKVKHVKKIKKKRKWVVYIYVGRMPTVKAQKYIESYIEKINKFFDGEDILVFATREEQYARVEMIDDEEEIDGSSNI